MPHRLQAEFATSEGEARYVEHLHRLVAGGLLDDAESVLLPDLAELDSDLGDKCLAATKECVVLSGWPELIDAIATFEGDPITGVALGMANDLDLAFEKGQNHSSYLLLGLYTDEAFAWSRAAREELLEQIQSSEPAWGGTEEDIEVYLDIEGLDAVNTALIHHKHRFFLRDGNPDKAPFGYVEFVLASWLRALRFHQAVAAQVAEHGLPGNIPVVSGTVELKPEVATVHFPERAGVVEQVQFASLLGAKPRRSAEIIEFEAPNIRQKLAAAQDLAPPAAPEPVAAPPQRTGFFARMFGRR